jgi:predicted double-glycine peptidase
MKIIRFPESRQVYSYDCGSNALQSLLVFAGIEEREDRIMKLACTTPKRGTSFAGVRRVFNYYGLPFREGRMTPNDLRAAIDAGLPTLISIQAYSVLLRYNKALYDGHYATAIGYDPARIIFEDSASFHRTWLADPELCERWHDIDNRRVVRCWGFTLLVKGHYRPNKLEHMA